MKLKVPYLIPRLNYRFNFTDIIISFRGIFRSQIDTKYLNQLFQREDIYYMNHARTGLKILLNSFNLKPNARIGVQIYTCHTVFNAIKAAGYIPVFLDINYDFTISLDDLERKKEQLDAIIVTHTFGMPADMDAIKRIIREVPIIEDCAHAFLSKYNNTYVGLHGDAAVFSIGKAKFPSIGDGGFVIINNRSIVNEFIIQFEKIPSPGLICEITNICKSIIFRILHNPLVYRIFTTPLLKNSVRKNKKIDNYSYSETKILKSNLFLFSTRIGDYRKDLEQQKNQVSNILKTIFISRPPEIYTNEKYSINGFMLPLFTKNPAFVISIFNKKGIELETHFSQCLKWARAFNYQSGECPQIEKIINNLIVFPTYYSNKCKTRILNKVLSLNKSLFIDHLEISSFR